MATAYIGIGSNLGNREENCKNAIKLLIENGVSVSRFSSRIETEPWGVKDQPMFINMAIMIETDIEPSELLVLLKNIEIDMGRRPATRWGPRVIDLDILLYEDRAIKTTSLEIPHPRMCEREFVLKPLSEIAPDIIHPVLGKSIKELSKDMSG
jgi:2-amino-4-hydroxy-6-hydroxymethyldihydropteridine diphosphokinase